MTKEISRIYLEGLDGAGKTTHALRLNDDLQDLGLRPVVLASPGKETFTGTVLRAHIGQIDPHRANKLFWYDLERTDRMIPRNTDVVLRDRGPGSVLTSNTDTESAQADIGSALARVKPGTQVYLDIPATEAYAREVANSTHPIDLEWLKEKEKRYNALLRQHPEDFVVIDATQPLDAVYQALLGLVQEQLKPAIEKQQKIHRLLYEAPGVIRFVLDNPVEVKPGVSLPMFVNIKATMGEVGVRSQIIEHMLEIAKEGPYDSVLGLESGGSYYAVTLANELGLPVAFHRTKSKAYSGATGDIVGMPPQQGSRVLVIDDVYATGQSAGRAAKRMHELGCRPSLLTAFSYSPDQEMAKRIGMDATSLTYFRGIRHVAQESGQLTPQDSQRLTEMVDVYRNTVFE